MGHEIYQSKKTITSTNILVQKITQHTLFFIGKEKKYKMNTFEINL